MRGREKRGETDLPAGRRLRCCWGILLRGQEGQWTQSRETTPGRGWEWGCKVESAQKTTEAGAERGAGWRVGSRDPVSI